jgi:hypothetical protein
LTKRSPTKHPSKVSAPVKHPHNATSYVSLRPSWHLISRLTVCPSPRNFFFEHFLGAKCYRWTFRRTCNFASPTKWHLVPCLHFVLMYITSIFLQNQWHCSIVAFRSFETLCPDVFFMSVSHFVKFFPSGRKGCMGRGKIESGGQHGFAGIY